MNCIPKWCLIALKDKFSLQKPAKINTSEEKQEFSSPEKGK